MTRSDAWKRRSCVVKYWAFKDELVNLWEDRELSDTFHVIFTLPMPVGWSNKKKLATTGLPHQQKPDTDNLLKAFCDCLLREDSHLWDVRATKLWGYKGSIELRELEPFK
ncbi:MAG: RusA family crossover junction endodeoxyribonuclease [Candidatus Nanopelagicaceae bacterium]